jgi:hypothetical protein
MSAFLQDVAEAYGDVQGEHRTDGTGGELAKQSEL